MHFSISIIAQILEEGPEVTMFHIHPSAPDVQKILTTPSSTVNS